jgi:hypothetical protein
MHNVAVKILSAILLTALAVALLVMVVTVPNGVEMLAGVTVLGTAFWLATRNVSHTVHETINRGEAARCCAHCAEKGECENE